MKTTTLLNQIKSSLRSALLLGSLALIATACSKGDSGGGQVAAAPIPAYGYYGTPQCATCQNQNQSFLANAVARNMNSGMELGLDFYGDGMTIAQMQQNPGYALGYRGYFAATGYVFFPYTMGDCGVFQPGLFQVTTVQPGIWGNDGASKSGEGLILQVNGPSPVRMMISGYITNATPPIRGRDGRTYPYQFVANIYVNNTSCLVTLY